MLALWHRSVLPAVNVCRHVGHCLRMLVFKRCPLHRWLQYVGTFDGQVWVSKSSLQTGHRRILSTRFVSLARQVFNGWPSAVGMSGHRDAVCAWTLPSIWRLVERHLLAFQ